jgi:hypothetical protein
MTIALATLFVVTLTLVCTAAVLADVEHSLRGLSIPLTVPF